MPCVGKNSNAVSCATFKNSPAVTATPFNRTTPSVGKPVTCTFSCEAGKLGSLGAGMPIGVGPLLGATVSVGSVVTGDCVSAVVARVAVALVVNPEGFAIV